MKMFNDNYLSKADQVAKQLLDKILESNPEPGQTVGTEAALLEAFSVSRPTLREGIRILETHGIVGQRPGPGGGIVVQRPSLETLAMSFSVYLRFNSIPFMDVLTTREVIEPALAAQAALHGSHADFAEMSASNDRMKALVDDQDQEEFISENRVFHGLVARASGNEVLNALWQTISMLASDEHHGVRYTFGNRLHVVAAHEGIIAACIRRDAAAAAKAMSIHVGELEHLVREHYHHLLGKPIGIVSRTSRKKA